MKKPQWVIEKEQARRTSESETIWLFGLHAVRDALANPAREKLRLVATRNALDRLGDVVVQSGVKVDMVDARKFTAPIDPGSVHQGAALEVRALDWGNLSETCAPRTGSDIVVLLDRVTDPHNVGAILRSSEVFGARAVIAPARHAAPETGALAKTASGALERQPYLRIRNLNAAISELQDLGYLVLGLAGEAEQGLEEVLESVPAGPVALVLGAEGPGLREGVRQSCDMLVKISPAGEFGSLNVSNAAAVSLYAVSGWRKRKGEHGS